MAGTTTGEQMAFERAAFGAAASCDSLGAVGQFIRNNPADRRARRNAAAYGMFLVAAEDPKPGTFFKDALALLDRPAFAKADLDAVAHHDLSVAELTASILWTAQQFVDEVTVPCAEWPTTEEIAEVVYAKALSGLDA